MTGLGKCQGMFHGFHVAYLTNEDYIRCLTESTCQGFVPGICILPDFMLVHDTTLVRVGEFHRVFYRDDVAFRFLITLVDQGSHRRRFARPCAADKENEAEFRYNQLWQYRWQAKVFVIR